MNYLTLRMYIADAVVEQRIVRQQSLRIPGFLTGAVIEMLEPYEDLTDEEILFKLSPPPPACSFLSLLGAYQKADVCRIGWQ